MLLLGVGRREIAGLIRDYDMSRQTGFTNGQTMNLWTNFVAPGSNDATQATEARKPTYVTAVQNGLAVSRHTHGAIGTNKYMATNAGGLSQGHIFIVCSVADPSASFGGGLWDLGTDAVNADFIPFSDGVIYCGAGSTTRKTVGNPATALNQFNVLEVESATNAWTFRLNGTDLFTTGTSVVGWDSGSIGRNNSDAGFAGDIGQFRQYDRVLSAGDAAAVRGALKVKWGTP